MATQFPTELDTFQDPSASTKTNAAGALSHSAQHNLLNDAVGALEAKVGIDGSTVPTSLDARVKALEDVIGGGISLTPLSGNESPEGVVSAPPGTDYWIPNVGRFTKNAGTGNSGWVQTVFL